MNDVPSRPATLQDLTVASGLLAFIGAGIMALQIIVINNATVSPSSVYTQLSVLREENNSQLLEIKAELSEITAFIDMHRTRMETQAQQAR